MKILYFSFVELDVPNACQTHTLGVLRGFSQNGCQVDALVPRPIKIRPIIPDVKFYYMWPWRFSRFGEAWVKFLSFIIMFILCLIKRFNVIYVREMEANPTPRLCSKLFHIPLYIEINDLIVLVAGETGLPPGVVRKIQRNQALDFIQAKGLIVPSSPMCKWITDTYGLPQNKVHMVLNGTEIATGAAFDKNRARKKVGIPHDCFCLGFIGNIYNRYDFSTTFQAITKCHDALPHLHFVVIGDGPIRSELDREINKLGLENKIIFTGYIQQEEFGRILPAIDIGLLLLTEKDATRYGPVTTKLSTYAYYKLPVITAGFSLQGYPDELIRALYLIPPGDTKALADMIIWLYRHPEERYRNAKVLHEFVMHKLTWDAVVRNILEIMKTDSITTDGG